MANNPIRLLLVDDNEIMLDLLNDLLEDIERFEIVGKAYDGRQAIDLIKSERPDIVVLDLCMPYIDGLGVMEAFQNEREHYFPKFIITSCVGQEHITTKAMKLGATYYMIKPFDYDHFLNRLNEIADDIDSSDKTVHEETEIEKVKENEKAKEIEIAIQPAVNEENRLLYGKIGELLYQIGVPPHTKGYIYIKDAIALVFEDTKYMMKITKELYPTVARKNDTTATRVERSIRNAIELTLTRGDQELLVGLFGVSVKNPNAKLTNSEFIALIAEKLKSGL